MKHNSFYSGICVLVFTVLSCNHLESDLSDDSLIYMPGEVLVSLKVEYNLKDLRSVLEDLEAKWKRPLAEGHVIEVIEGDEDIWIKRLKEEEIIQNVQLNRFGFSYRLVQSGDFPIIKNDSLWVELTYSGCTAGHAYSLEHIRKDSTYALWLFKKTPDEPCRAIIRDIQSFRIPQQVTKSSHVIVLNPVDERISIRN